MILYLIKTHHIPVGEIVSHRMPPFSPKAHPLSLSADAIINCRGKKQTRNYFIVNKTLISKNKNPSCAKKNL